MYVFFFNSGDVSSKRSDDLLAKSKAKTVVENLDLMINFMLERYVVIQYLREQEEVVRCLFNCLRLRAK